MKILVIGGTRFLGRFIVEEGLKAGHDVTLFNRGFSNPDLFSEVETISGDRNTDLDKLDGHQWDAVIDTCGYLPDSVSASAAKLAHLSKQYTFISSCSVYSDLTHVSVDEDAPVARLTDAELEAVKAMPFEEAIQKHYGALKLHCEEEVQAKFPNHSLIIRPGLIVGPYDPTDRFTYWVERGAKGGEILAPGNPDLHIQFIDVRDLAYWIVKMVGGQKTGIFNATGPAERTSMAKLLETCVTVGAASGEIQWVPEKFLLKHNVGHWIEMPLWIPESLNMPGFLAADCRRAISEGLTYRSMAETIQATLDWTKERTAHERRAGMTAEREQELLQLYHLTNLV